MIIVPFQAEHLFLLDAQDSQQYMRAYITPESAKALEPTQAYTAMEGGKVLGCGGLIEMWPNRALVWSFLDRDIGKHFIALHRIVRRFIEATPYRRLEAEVDCDFEAGHRWMRMLGFEQEAERMRSYRVDGGDSALYAKVR